MSFSNGNERRKLNAKWEHLRVQYREAGMSEDRNRLQKPENGAGEAMQPPKTGFSKKKSTILPTKYGAFLVENSGIEPLTSCMPCKRSPETRTHAPPHKGARMNNIWRWSASFFQKCNLTLESNQQ